MYCRFCGCENEDDSSFCEKCGKQIGKNTDDNDISGISVMLRRIWGEMDSVSVSDENKRKSFALTIITLCIEIMFIVLLFTPMFKISVDSLFGYLSEISVSTLSDYQKKFEQISIVESTENIAKNINIFMICNYGVIAANIAYLLYYTYTFIVSLKKDSHNNNYIFVPNVLSIVIITITAIYFSSTVYKDIAEISFLLPFYLLIMLVVIQAIINIVRNNI